MRNEKRGTKTEREGGKEGWDKEMYRPKDSVRKIGGSGGEEIKKMEG